jgi:pimeloyl-ACP methyl ester carboxylesterase
MKIFARAIIVFLCVTLTGCNLFNTTPPTPPVPLPTSSITSVTANAAVKAVLGGFPIVLTGEVQGNGTFDKRIDWSVQGTSGVFLIISENKSTYTAPFVTADTPVRITAVAKADPSKKTVVDIIVKAAQRSQIQSIGSTGGMITVSNSSTPVGAARIESAGLTGTSNIELRQTTILDTQLPSGVKPLGAQTVMTIPIAQIGSSSNPSSFTLASRSNAGVSGDAFAFVQIHLGGGKLIEYLDNYTIGTNEAITISAMRLREVMVRDGTIGTTIQISMIPIQFVAGISGKTNARPQGFDIFNGGLIRPEHNIAGIYRIPNLVNKSGCEGKTESFDQPNVNLVSNSVNSTKTPLILVHGWMAVAAKEKEKIFPAVCGWTNFIDKFYSSSSLQNSYDLYAFNYDTFDPTITQNAELFRNQIKQVFGTKNVVILAHSMGGLLSNTVLQNYNDINISRIISLGTPYLGSVALLCKKLSDDGQSCKEATPHPRALDALKANYQAENILQQAGANAAQDYQLGQLTKFQGTRDLSWAVGDIEIGCGWKWPFESRRCYSSSNPITSRIPNMALTRKITGFNGDGTLGNNPLLKPLGAAITKATGHTTDGIVPLTSACFQQGIISGDTPPSNPCSNTALGEVVSTQEDHLSITNIWGTGPVYLLESWLLQAISGTLEGLVQDVVTKAPVAAARISVLRNGIEVGTALTNNVGTYKIPLLAGTDYTVKISKSGYLTAPIQNVEVVAQETRTLETLLLIDNTQTGNGGISGSITDAFTGNGVPNATLNLRSGSNVRSGMIVATSATDSNGLYQFTNLPIGYYTAEVMKSGFITGYFSVYSVTGIYGNNQKFSISPTLLASEIRIVLTWGLSPSDLDSHLTGPDDSGNRFHVYFSDKSYDETTTANLDVDDQSSYGPETITINSAGLGRYRYSVHDYTNSGSSTSSSLSNSSARVRVFQGTAATPVLDEFVPVDQLGDLWSVFELENGIIRRINTITTTTGGAASVQGAGLNNENQLFRNLPSKR